MAKVWRRLISTVVAAALCLPGSPAVLGQSNCIYLGDRLVCPDTGGIAGQEAASSDEPDRTPPSTQPLDDEGVGAVVPPSQQPDGDRRRDDDGDRNWLIPGLIVGAAALIAITQHLKQERVEERPDEREGVRRLLKEGPQLPRQFNTSAFGIRGLIKGGWPIVVDYEQLVPGTVQLRISIPGSDIVTYRLDQFGVGRHLLRFELPRFLGSRLKPALVALTAADPEGRGETLEGFRVFGVGIGPRATGSVAIDQVRFGPETARVREGDTARYAFHSQSDFDHAAVEFMHVTQSPDGVRVRYVNGRRVAGGVEADGWIGADGSHRWNGLDEDNRVSEGRHQLQVRVWDEGGDWLGAWSDSLVTIR